MLERFESFRAMPYLCEGGWWTVGYGHAIRKGEDFSMGVTPEQGEAILAKDVAVAEAAVRRLISVPLSEHQHDALASFTFNVGSGALQRSRLRACVNRNEHDDVPLELLRWIWAGGHRSMGLLRRRTLEARLYAGSSI